jgi:hypothetical protein
MPQWCRHVRSPDQHTLLLLCPVSLLFPMVQERGQGIPRDFHFTVKMPRNSVYFIKNSVFRLNKKTTSVDNILVWRQKRRKFTN